MQAAVGASGDGVRLEELLLRVELKRPRDFLLIRDVWRRPGGDKNRASGQRPCRVAVFRYGRAFARENQRFHGGAFVGLSGDRVEVLCERDALFERLGHFFMVQSVSGRVNQPLAVRNGDASPGPDERDEVGCLASRRGSASLAADGAPVRQVLVEHTEFFRVVETADLRLAEFSGDRLVLLQRLLDLDRVVRHQFCRGVDRRQTATDHHGRHAHLQVRQCVAFERARELQGHEEVARRSDPADQVVLHVDHGRTPSAARDGDVIEAIRPGVFEGKRAAEADAAVDLQAPATGQRQMQQRQEVLVPSHRDAVFRDSAESSEDAIVELAVNRAPVADRQGRRRIGADDVRRKRLDLQTVDPDDPETFVQEIVGECVAGGPETDHEDLLAVVAEARRAAGR